MEKSWVDGMGQGHTCDIPMRVVLANKHIKAIEHDDHGEIVESEPRSVWLESGLEHKSIAVDSLRLERLVELDVGDADRAPCEKRGDGDQVLEPSEDGCRATRVDRQVCEGGDGGCDCDAPVGDTGFAAAEKEARGLLVLCQSEEVSGSCVEESVGG